MPNIFIITNNTGPVAFNGEPWGCHSEEPYEIAGSPARLYLNFWQFKCGWFLSFPQGVWLIKGLKLCKVKEVFGTRNLLELLKRVYRGTIIVRDVWHWQADAVAHDREYRTFSTFPQKLEGQSHQRPPHRDLSIITFRRTENKVLTLKRAVFHPLLKRNFEQQQYYFPRYCTLLHRKHGLGSPSTIIFFSVSLYLRASNTCLWKIISERGKCPDHTWKPGKILALQATKYSSPIGKQAEG